MRKDIVMFKQTDKHHSMVVQRLSTNNGWVDICEVGLIRPDEKEFYHKSGMHRIVLTDEPFPAKHHNVQ